MKFDELVERMRLAIINLITLIGDFFKKFDLRPNYEKTDIWTATYPYEGPEA